MRSKNPEKHHRILDAAIKIFADKGFFNARVSDVAREAEVADGTVYLYFDSKDDLLISVFEEKMRELIDRFRATTLEMKDAVSRLECLIRMHLLEFQENPDLAAVFQVELRQSQRFMRGYAKCELKEYLDLIGEIVEQGQREGAFRTNLPSRLVTHLIFGTLDEVVSTWVLSGMKYDLANLAAPIAGLFLSGIGENPHAGGTLNAQGNGEEKAAKEASLHLSSQRRQK